MGPGESGGLHQTNYSSGKTSKPRTIAGYRTSVPDGLGSSGQMISQILDFNHLIASFHRDRPSANRDFPNWALALVLLASFWAFVKS